MNNKEMQIEEMTQLIGYSVYNYPREAAERLYNGGFRKLNEVTLKLDLGDRTPEEIKEIMEKFSKAAETSSCTAVPNNEEQIRKQVAKEILQDLYDQANNIWQAIEWTTEDIKQYAQKYGVEVDE